MTPWWSAFAYGAFAGAVGAYAIGFGALRYWVKANRGFWE